MMGTKIRALVMDVDGTLTDGKIYMGADGEIMRSLILKMDMLLLSFTM